MREINSVFGQELRARLSWLLGQNLQARFPIHWRPATKNSGRPSHIKSNLAVTKRSSKTIVRNIGSGDLSDDYFRFMFAEGVEPINIVSNNSGTV